MVLTMLNALVSAIDRRLRAKQHIFEYSDGPRCMFRAGLAVAPTDIALSDGTYLPAGSRLINLHLWNEHVPPFPAQGPTLGWARKICHDFEISLEELATFVARHRALDDVAAFGGKMMFGSTEQTQLVAHFSARYGFVAAIPEPVQTIPQRLHLVGENILISLIVLARNPAALRTDVLRRDRVSIYIRREELMRRFGARKHSAQS
jgi:hypothetical protein